MKKGEDEVLEKSFSDTESLLAICWTKEGKPLAKNEIVGVVSSLKMLKAAASASISRRLASIEEGEEDAEFEMAEEMAAQKRELESQIEHLQKMLSGNKAGARRAIRSTAPKKALPRISMLMKK